jgi:hypothetical protein
VLVHGKMLYQLVLIWSEMPSSLSAASTFFISSASFAAASSAVSPSVSIPIVTEILSVLTLTVAVPEVETTDSMCSSNIYDFARQPVYSRKTHVLISNVFGDRL